MALNGHHLWKSPLLDFTGVERNAKERRKKWGGKPLRFTAFWAIRGGLVEI